MISHKLCCAISLFFKAMVYVDVELEDFKSADNFQFKIWTDKTNGKYWHKSLLRSGSSSSSKIEPFFIGLDASEIHILGHDYQTSSIIYHKIDVDCNREVKGSHGLDIHAAIKTSQKVLLTKSASLEGTLNHLINIYFQFQSVLKVEEIQSGKGLSGAKVEIEVGVAHQAAQTFIFEVSHDYDDSVHFHMSEDGILVGWHVYGSDNHQRDIGTGITPFRTKAKLLKTV